MTCLSAIFRNPQHAHKAAGALLDHGLSSDRLTLITLHQVPEDPEHVEGETEHPEREITTTTPADAAHGAFKGAGVGLGLGALATLVCLFVPGFGWVTGGGALATALTATLGTTAAGAITGGAVGWLVDQGLPHEIAEDYEQALRDQGALLTVELSDTELSRFEVEGIATKYGAERVAMHACFGVPAES